MVTTIAYMLLKAECKQNAGSQQNRGNRDRSRVGSKRRGTFLSRRHLRVCVWGGVGWGGCTIPRTVTILHIHAHTHVHILCSAAARGFKRLLKNERETKGL